MPMSLPVRSTVLPASLNPRALIPASPAEVSSSTVRSSSTSSLGTNVRGRGKGVLPDRRAFPRASHRRQNRPMFFSFRCAAAWPTRVADRLSGVATSFPVDPPGEYLLVQSCGEKGRPVGGEGKRLDLVGMPLELRGLLSGGQVPQRNHPPVTPSGSQNPAPQTEGNRKQAVLVGLEHVGQFPFCQVPDPDQSPLVPPLLPAGGQQAAVRGEGDGVHHDVAGQERGEVLLASAEVPDPDAALGLEVLA